VHTGKAAFRLLLAITGAAIAILLLAGCGPSAPPTPTHPCAEPSWGEPWEYPRDFLTHSVEVTPRVAALKETVLIKQTLKNISGRELSFSTASPNPYGFRVTKPNGDYVMDSLCDVLTNAVWGSHHQGPDEVSERTYKWNQRDMFASRFPPASIWCGVCSWGQVKETRCG